MYRNAARGGPNHGNRVSAQKFVKIGPEICSRTHRHTQTHRQTQRQTDRRTDRNTPLPYRDWVKMNIERHTVSWQLMTRIWCRLELCFSSAPENVIELTWPTLEAWRLVSLIADRTSTGTPVFRLRHRFLANASPTLCAIIGGEALPWRCRRRYGRSYDAICMSTMRAVRIIDCIICHVPRPAYCVTRVTVSSTVNAHNRPTLRRNLYYHESRLLFK